MVGDRWTDRTTYELTDGLMEKVTYVGAQPKKINWTLLCS